MSFLRQFLVTVATLLAANFAVGWHIGAVDGDLTRLGRLAERDYAARGEPQHFHRFATPDARPTVLVLGDSLTTGNVWVSQARAPRPESRFIIFAWHALGYPGCLNAWLDATLARYPSVEHVVIETGEVAYFERFNVPQRPCNAAQVSPVRTPAGDVTDSRDTALSDVMPDPLYGVSALIDSIGPGVDNGRAHGADVHRLTTSALFSNGRSDRLVSYSRDVEVLGASRAELASLAENVAEVERHLADRKLGFTFMLVPSKTTVYEGALAAARTRAAGLTPWQVLDARCVRQIRLDTVLAAGAARSVDFFRPNDTHPSIRGYSAIARAWVDSLPAAGLRTESGDPAHRCNPS